MKITEVDVANLIVSEPAPDPVAEGGDVTFTVKLKSKPTADVTIQLTPDDEVSMVGPSSLTFSPDNYATAQTVTVHAKQDAVAQGPHTGYVTLVASSTDTTYSGMSLGVTVNITDSNMANLIVSKPTPDPVEESGRCDLHREASSPSRPVM